MHMIRRNLVLVLLWGIAAAFLGTSACGGDDKPPDPVPADTAKRKVLLEIDRMAGTPALQLEQVINGKTVSLKSIYEDAGIELDVRQDQIDLPRQDQVGLPDLHAMMTAFRSLEAPADVMRVHALILTSEREDADTLGIMFDFGEDDQDDRPREGFAVFADPHAGLPGGLNPELLLTMAHELAHCFNLHHPDWEGEAFRTGATIESYSQADSVRWTLSDHSKAHIRTDPGREVWPGRSNIGFGLVTKGHLARHNLSPSEAFRIVEPTDFNARRPEPAKAAAFRKAAQRDRSRFVSSDNPVKLRLETAKQNYVAGEPVVLTVALHNTGTTNQSVYPLLDPKYRFLNIEVLGPGETDFETFQPVLLADARGVKPETLAPGASIHEEARIYFGAEGWVFKRPGEYIVRGDYAAPLVDGRPRDERERLGSADLKIVITEPASSAERRARDLIVERQQGIYMVLGGGDHLKSAKSKLQTVVQEAPNAAQTAAVRLALGTGALNPTIDPQTGVQSQPRLDEAKKYLDATLDSPQLSAVSVVKAQAELADALDKKGRTAEAKRVRTETVQKMQRHESAKEYIDDIKRPSKSPQKPPGKPPGGQP
jgi:hypothetical protein